MRFRASFIISTKKDKDDGKDPGMADFTAHDDTLGKLTPPHVFYL